MLLLCVVVVTVDAANAVGCDGVAFGVLVDVCVVIDAVVVVCVC